MTSRPESQVLQAIGRFLLAWGLCGIAVAQQKPLLGTRAVVNQYCVGCHNEKTMQGGLALNTLDPDNVAEKTDLWEKVVRKLRARYMPPAGLPRPDEKTYESVITSLEGALDRTSAARPNPGRSDAFRRLNRTEYRNSIRDLLALDVDVLSLLPSDETALGFDNITVGELSPTLLDRYLAAAQKISHLAVGGSIRSPGGDTFMLPPDLTQESEADELPFGSRGGTAVRYNFPLDAEYEIQVRLARDRDSHVEGLNDHHQLEMMLDGVGIKSFPLEPPGKDVLDHYGIDKDLHIRIPVKAGPHVIAATFIKKTSALLETELQPLQVHFNMDRHPRIQPAVYTITVLGPYNASGPGDTPSRQRIFVCRPTYPCRGRRLCQPHYFYTGAPCLSPAGNGGRSCRTYEVLQGISRAFGFRWWNRNGAEGSLGQSKILVPYREGPGWGRPEYSLSSERPRTGLAALILLMEQYPG